MLLDWHMLGSSRHAKLARGRGDEASVLTNTGGKIAVRALGSTGCLMVISSSASFEMVEFDRIRLVVVF